MSGAGWRILGHVVTAVAVVLVIFLLMPTLVIVPLSFSSESFISFPPPGFSLRWYRAFVQSPEYQMAILNSLKIGLPAAALATVMGTMAALAVVRGDFPGRQVFAAFCIAPLVLPQIILAIGLFPVMVKLGIIGSYPAILLGHTVIAMPLVFITVSAALKAYAPSYEMAAMTLGATPWRTFRHVTFPMIRPGVLVGFVFAFTFSFDELILAIFLTNPVTRTVPRLLWEQLNYQMTPVIASATVVLLLVTLALLFAAAILSRRPASGAEGGS